MYVTIENSRSASANGVAADEHNLARGVARRGM